MHGLTWNQALAALLLRSESGSRLCMVCTRLSSSPPTKSLDTRLSLQENIQVYKGGQVGNKVGGTFGGRMFVATATRYCFIVHWQLIPTENMVPETGQFHASLSTFHA